MRILLIMPLETHVADLARLCIGEVMEPMGLTYIAAAARAAGHRVKIVDRRVLLWACHYDLKAADERFFDDVEEFVPELVGFHVPTVMLKDVQHVSERIRSQLPTVRLVIGGPHPSLNPGAALIALPHVDIAVSGDGEITLQQLAADRRNAEVPGIAYREGRAIKRTAPRPLLRELDELELPARDLINMSFYLNPAKNILVDYTKSYGDSSSAVKMGELITSRGCPFECGFCSVPQLSERNMRYHSPARVVEDLTDLMSYGANYVYMNDDVFTIHRRRVLELCREFIRSDIHKRVQWVAQSRAEHVDAEVLTMMRQAGCVRVEFGFESGSARMLEIMHKRARLADYDRAIDVSRRAGLAVQANIIFGYPGETADDISATIDFLRRTKPDSVLLNAFWPLPGTAIWDELRGGRFQTVSATVSTLRYEFNDPLFMPAHPFLARYNFTAMPDSEYREMFWRLLELAPEAREYLDANRRAFDEVACLTDGLFAS